MVKEKSEKLEQLVLEVNPTVNISVKGDFQETVSNQKVLLPKDVMDFAEGCNIHSAAQLVTYIHIYPTTIRNHFGWEYEDVFNARDKLISNLEGYVHEDILHPPIDLKSRYIGAKKPR